MPTSEITRLMQQGTHPSVDDQHSVSRDWKGVLVLPGNHRENAAYHVGLIGELMKQRLLPNIQRIYAQGFSAVVAAVLWHNWHALVEIDNDADLLASWITPMQAVLTQPAMHLCAALRAVGVDDTSLFIQDSDDDKVKDSDGTHQRPTLHLCVRVDHDLLTVHCYEHNTFKTPTLHYVLCHLLAIRNYYQHDNDDDAKTNPGHFQNGVQVRASLWAWVLEHLEAKRDACTREAWFVSSAHCLDEMDAFDHVRTQAYHKAPSTLMWCTIPYHLHRGNPPGAARSVHQVLFEAPLEEPSSLSINSGMNPHAMQSLIRWGKGCMARKLLLLPNAFETEPDDASSSPHPGEWTQHQRDVAMRFYSLRRSYSWSAQQQCADVLQADEGDGQCRAMERDIRVTRRPQYHQHEWDLHDTNRENQHNPDHTARELARQLVFFQETTESTPRWPSQIPAVTLSRHDQEWSDTDDTDMESILQDVQHAEMLRNTYYETLAEHIDVNRSHHRSTHSKPPLPPPASGTTPATASASTPCQTFCSWLRGPPTTAQKVPRPVRPPIPRLQLPQTDPTAPPRRIRNNRRRTHKDKRRTRARHSDDTPSESDELAQASFDSFYVNVEQDGGPTSQIATRAISKRSYALEAAGLRTPRKPVSGLVDFVRTQHNMR